MSKEKDTVEGFEGFQAVDAENFNWDFDDTTPQSVAAVVDAIEDNIATDDNKDADKGAEDAAKKEAKVMDEVFNWETPTAETETTENVPLEVQETTTETKSSAVTTLEFLKDKGLVEYELEEGEELTDDKALELAEEGWEKALTEEVQAIIKDLPAEGQGLLKVANSGGDINAYLQTLVKNSTAGINKDTDMTVEENQVLAITLDLQDQEYDPEYIESHIQTLKDSGKLETMAGKIAEKRIKKQTDEATAVIAQAAKQQEDRKEAIKARKAELATSLQALDNIKGVVLNKKDKEALPAYISIPSVELKDGRVITPMQEDLFKALADPNKSILIAKLLQSDFDFSSISAKTLSDYSKKVEENLSNSKAGKEKEGLKSGSPHKVKKSLADMLGD